MPFNLFECGQFRRIISFHCKGIYRFRIIKFIPWCLPHDCSIDFSLKRRKYWDVVWYKQIQITWRMPRRHQKQGERIIKENETTKQNENIEQFLIYCSNFLATIPSGGLHSTVPFLTSSQLVLRQVPLLSTKLFIMARRVSSLPSLKICWNNAFKACSPSGLSSSMVFSTASKSIFCFNN